MDRICRLRHHVQPYDWGSTTALAELLGCPSPALEPQAELWMGVHPQAPSDVLVDGRWVSLRDVLGSELPYLFKVLAVERPLSIQAHPDRRQAIEGCRREDEAGLARDAPSRNYRDDQPKPEILYALTPFSMLRGFRSPAQILALVAKLGLRSLLPGQEALATAPASSGLERFFRGWMELEGGRRQEILEALVDRCRERGLKDDPIARWILRLHEACPGDRGVLAPVFLHLRRLMPGEVIYTDPGVLHAYLDGLGVELMTSSDNVLRGGLTTKHCDVPELLKILRFAPDAPEPLAQQPGTAEGVRRFEVPQAGLVLSVFDLVPGRRVTSGSPTVAEILLCTKGDGRLWSDREEHTFDQGDSFLVPEDTGGYRLEGTARLFRASAS